MFLKLENLQPTFSFKIRGAFNALLRLTGEVDPPRAIVTASAGNHGRALAAAAQAQGLDLTVYLPEAAPRAKIESIRRAGAALRFCPTYDEAEARAKAHGSSSGVCFVSAYSDVDVIAGAGTVGLEILEDDPGIEAIIVPVGGGGLVSGIGIAAAGRPPAAEVIGVEVEASSPFTHGLRAGRIVGIDVRPTLADGLAGNLDPEAITFALVRRLVQRIALVGETDLRAAIRGLVSEERLVAEGAGAAAVAALHSGKLDVSGRKVAAVVSGGNIDLDKLAGILGG